MRSSYGRSSTRWIASGIAWTLAISVAAAPLFADTGAEPPFGRPWFLGRGLGALLLLTGLLFWPTSVPGAADPRERARRLSALLFLAIYLALVSNYATLGSGDNLPNRFLPAALLAGDGVDLSRVAPSTLHDHYSVVQVDGRILSAFPLGTGILATPYLALARAVQPGSPPARDGLTERQEKHLAAILVALSAVLFFAAALRLFDRRWATAASLAFVLCTPLFYCLGQALWSQTGEIFFLSLSLFLIFRSGVLTAAAAGLSAGLAFACRPTALLLVPLLFFLLEKAPAARRRLFAILALASIGLTIGFDLTLYGHPLGGYGLLNAAEVPWQASGFPGRLAGVLASPSRGALWFLPALFAAAWIARRPRSEVARRLFLVSVATGAAILLLTASYLKWWGGSSIGPRLLAEAAFPFALLLGLALGSASRRAIAVLALLCSFQAAIGFGLANATGAREWTRMVMPDENREILWSVGNSQLAAILPGWYFEPSGPYLNQVVRGSTERDWLPVDLAPLANGRYDLPATRRDLPAWRTLYLPRLGPESGTLGDRALFRFLPPDRPNLVRVCGDEPARTIPIPDVPVRRLVATIAWRAALPTTETTTAGAVRIRFRGGREENHWLRDNRDVYDTESVRRRIVLPAHRIAAAHSWSHDALFLQRYTLSGQDRRIDSIDLAGPPEGRDGCLFLLALSVSGDGGSAAPQ